MRRALDALGAERKARVQSQRQAEAARRASRLTTVEPAAKEAASRDRDAVALIEGLGENAEQLWDAHTPPSRKILWKILSKKWVVL